MKLRTNSKLISESDIIEYQNVKLEIKNLEKRADEIKGKIIGIASGLRTDEIEIGKVIVKIDLVERKYPAWQDIVLKLHGKDFVNKTIKKTKAIVSKIVRVRVAA